MNTEVKQCSKKDCTAPRVVNRVGTESLCREHKNEKQRNWRAANREAVKANNTKYFAKLEGHVYLDVNTGYFKHLGFNHPACSPSGITRYHRIVLWDKVDGKNVPCAECGGLLRWDVPSNHPDYIVADHIDENKQNNDASNIDPVHGACNTRRAFRNKAKRQAAESDAA